MDINRIKSYHYVNLYSYFMVNLYSPLTVSTLIDPLKYRYIFEEEDSNVRTKYLGLYRSNKRVNR